MNPHLQRAFDQENQIWKYFIVIFLVLFISQTIGALPLLITILVSVQQIGESYVKSENYLDFSAYGIDPNLGLVLMLIPFLVMLFLSVFLIKTLHKRSLMDVINGGRSFRWSRFMVGFFTWGIIIFATIIFSVFFNQDNYKIQFSVREFVPLVIISFIMLSLQSGSEEFLFRGYLVQGIAARTGSSFWVIVISSTLFAVVHGLNPEVKEFGFWLAIPLYFLFGAILAIITIMDNGIEMAIGFHSANNVLSAIFITSKSSVLQTPALFYEKETHFADQYWNFLLAALLFLLMIKMFYGWNFKKLMKPIREVENAA